MTPGTRTTVGRRASVTSRLWGGALWNLVGAVFNQGSTLLISLAAARFLGRETFGAFGALVTTISTVTGIASLGMAFTATRFVARFRTSDPRKAGRLVGLCLALSVGAAALSSTILVLLAPLIGARILHRPELTALVVLSALASFFNVVNLAQVGLLAGLEEFGSIARAGAVSGTLYLLLCGMGLAWFGLPGVIGGIAVSGAAQALALAAMLVRRLRKHAIRPTLTFREEWSTVRQFALPAALPGLTTMPSLWLASMFLLQRADGYGQLALFVAANSLRTLVLFVPNMVVSVSLPVMNAEVGRGEFKEVSRAFWISLRTAVVFGVVGALIASVLSGPLMSLFGRSFVDGRDVLLLLMLAVVPEVLFGVFGQVLATHDRMWTSLLVLAIPKDLSFVLLAFFLAGKFGAAGVAFAYAAATLYTALAGAFLVVRSGVSRPLAIEQALTKSREEVRPEQ